jgi:hypothetical protein
VLFSATSLDISPSNPLPLSGWSHRTSEFKSIKLGLEANILIFDQNETLYFFISIDCLFISSQLKKVIIARLADQDIKCNTDDILLLASHTHFAPSLDESKPQLGKIDQTYIDQTFNKVADACLSQIKTGFENGSAQYFKGAYSKVINRRRKVSHYRKNIFKWNQEVLVGPNILGPKNDDIHLINLLDDKANCICIFWSFACHPVDEPDFNSLSSDYVGIVRDHIRKTLNANIPVIFAQGFAGNIKAKLSPELDSLSSKLKTILKLPDVFKAEPENYKQWCLGLLSSIDKTLSSKPTIIIDKALSKQIAHIPLKELIHNYEGPESDLKLQKWQLGSVLLICMSAEPVTEYNNILRSIINDNFIPVGYTADSFGYLPVSKQVKEGGYEAEGFFKLFSIEGKFKECPEEKVIAYLDQLKS